MEQSLISQISRDIHIKKEQMLFEYFKDKTFNPLEYELVEHQIDLFSTKYSLRYKNSSIDLVYFIYSYNYV